MSTKQLVLVVDDVVANIQLLNEILQDSYRVLFATSGEDALSIASEMKPDIVLLDVMMPGMDGYEVSRRLHEDPVLRNIPVIFVTALSEELNETQALELRAVDYITKPFNPNIVKLRVRNHLELKRQRDILARLSHYDGLTGLANRIELEEYLEGVWRTALREGKTVALLMIDIDYFKAYNDAYGHIAGDECLKKIAAALKKTVKQQGDMIARYGGEEFACVLVDTDVHSLLLTADDMLEKARSLKIPHASSKCSEFVTVSIGAAISVPGDTSNFTELIKASEDRLLAAKDGGRNMVKY